MPGRWNFFVARNTGLAGVTGSLLKHLPPLNFITIHYAYFLIIIIISSLIFWGSSEPNFSISYTDSIFLVVSAMTESGLNTVNLSEMTTWQQVVLFLLIILGSSIWVSIWTIAFRKHVLEKRFHEIACEMRDQPLPSPPNFAEGDQIPSRAWPKDCSPLACRPPRHKGKSRICPLQNSHMTETPEIVGSTKLSGSYTCTASTALELSSVIQPRLLDVAAFEKTSHVTFADSPSSHLNSGAHAPARNIPVRRAQAACKTVDGDRMQGGNTKSKLVGLGSFAFLSQHTVGRNSQFHGLSRVEREELGGCEYRALKLLFVVVPLYFFLWQLLGCIALGAWINNYMAPVATGNGINPWWLGIFNGASAFNNSGMSLLDANMIPFENAHFVIITMGLMILAGNTAYPVFLRFIFWAMLNILHWSTGDDQFSETKETIAFILQYPRRVYTNLFPARPTWWLFFMIVLLNCIDWVAFEVLNLKNPVVNEIPMGSRILDGLFQAIAVRSGGFYIVPIANVYIGLQVLYVIMMYISVYPVVITMRHSNVYEERSLGIYYDDPYIATQQGDFAVEATDASKTLIHELWNAVRRAFVPWHGVGGAPPLSRCDNPESRINFISQQIHGQLAHDLWWLVLAVLVITTIETSHFMADPISYSVFNIIFEVVSAYGCVGISVGIPSAAYSFSGGWHNASKLVLCLVMLRGRHRGLPVALDRAVRLPGDQLHRDEEEDYRIRCSLSNRRLSADGGGFV